MPNDETLKEVGRFVVEFNTLDELITALAAAIFECTEWTTAEYLRKRDTGQKLEQIREVCNRLAGTHGLRESFIHRALLSQIEAADTILKKRNAVMHSEVTIKRGERPSVQLKQSTVELSPGALSVLVEETNRAVDGLRTAYYDFMESVHKAREAAAKKQGHRA